MQRLSNWSKRIAVKFAIAIASTVSISSPASAFTYETFSDIVCHNYGLGVKEVAIKGWGVGYAGNQHIEIDRIVTVNGEWYFTETTDLITSPTGAWSTTTDDHDASLISGNFNLVVWVSRYSDGAFLNSGSDSCSM